MILYVVMCPMYVNEDWHLLTILSRRSTVFTYMYIDNCVCVTVQIFICEFIMIWHNYTAIIGSCYVLSVNTTEVNTNECLLNKRKLKCVDSQLSKWTYFYVPEHPDRANLNLVPGIFLEIKVTSKILTTSLINDHMG